MIEMLKSSEEAWGCSSPVNHLRHCVRSQKKQSSTLRLPPANYARQVQYSTGPLIAPVGRPQTHHRCYNSYAGLTPYSCFCQQNALHHRDQNCSLLDATRAITASVLPKAPSVSRTSYWSPGRQGKGNMEKLQKLQIWNLGLIERFHDANGRSSRRCRAALG